MWLSDLFELLEAYVIAALSIIRNTMANIAAKLSIFKTTI